MSLITKQMCAKINFRLKLDD